jgi:broad specificity phosphatase PhoE
MGVLHLVRHGQATAHDGGYDALSELGREQARAVGAELLRRGARPDRVVTGGLRRQRQTAEELLGVLGGPAPETDPRWDEYDHVAILAARHGDPGVLIGRLGSAPDPARALQDLLDDALAAWMTAADHSAYAESCPAFTERVRGALDDVLSSRGTTVVVASAGPISAVVARLLGIPAQGWLSLNRVMVNTGITTVTVGRSGASLVSVNDHAHVAGDGRRLLTYR